MQKAYVRFVFNGTENISIKTIQGKKNTPACEVKKIKLFCSYIEVLLSYTSRSGLFSFSGR